MQLPDALSIIMSAQNMDKQNTADLKIKFLQGRRFMSRVVVRS